MRIGLQIVVAALALALTVPASAAPPKTSSSASAKKGASKRSKSSKSKGSKSKGTGSKKSESNNGSKKSESSKSKPDADQEPATSEEPEAIDDDVEGDEGAGEGRRAPKTAELDLTDAELDKRIQKDVTTLGSMSVGYPNSGALINAVHMPKSDRWRLMEPGLAWATKETVDYLSAAIEVVFARHPGSHPLYIGHMSAKHGGHLSPHKSHQAGRDFDISYFYSEPKKLKWYTRVNADNLDRARTWTFVRALLTHTDVQYIFINTSVQRLLKEYALEAGEDASWLDDVFQYGGAKGSIPIIRHASGHDTHIHVRFFNPIAQELGRRAHPFLVKRGLIKPRTNFLQHKAQKGDILGRLATRYKTTVDAIKRANKLRSNQILAGRTYLIPKKDNEGSVRRVARVVVPERRLPPEEGGGTRAKKAASAETR